MTCASKRRSAVGTLLLFTLSRANPFWRMPFWQEPEQRHDPAIPQFPWHIAPPWEYILREIIFKSVTPSPSPSPSPPDANAPHKRPLDASFYGGPATAEHPNDDTNVVLSRGNVYHSLNGHWMLCQDGCVDCEPCAAQRDPSFKWVLRRVKRSPLTDPPLYDLQLTIIPQVDDRLYASNLWPNSYVYVTSRGEGTSFPVNGTRYGNDQKPPPSLENSLPEQHHQRSKDLWRLTEREYRDSVAGRDKIPQQDNRAVRENASTEKIETEKPPERKYGFGSTSRHRSPLRPAEKPAMAVPTVRSRGDVTANAHGGEEANQLIARLILGTDQRGQKYLVHVVPADRSISPYFVAGEAAPLDHTITKRERQTYQRMLRRVFDSNAHRRSIENFLESPTSNVNERRTSSSDSMKVSGLSWNDRDASRASANLEPFYMKSDGRTEKNLRYKDGYDYQHTKQNVVNYYSGHRDMNPIIAFRRKKPADLNWERQRPRIRVMPFVHAKREISRINSLTSSNNPSLDAISKSGFVISLAKQIDSNDTSVDKVFVSGNNFTNLNSIMIARENEQLSNREKLENDDVYLKFKVPQRSFRIIVTTESPNRRSFKGSTKL